MEQELRQILVEVCGIAPDFDRAAHLYFTLGVPSVKAMLLLMVLEERFAIQVPDEQFVEAVTLEKLTAMVEGLQRADA
jgi:acyl carrier protein